MEHVVASNLKRPNFILLSSTTPFFSSCKCFFRRCVSNHLVYKCTNKCEITKGKVVEKRLNTPECSEFSESRISCRACRYAKCIAVGLDPGMVNSDSAATVQMFDQPGFNTPEEPVAEQCPSNDSDGFTPSLPSSAVAVALRNVPTQLSTYQPPSLSTSNRMAVRSCSLKMVVDSGLASGRNELFSAPRRDIGASQP
jgi:hypothetical protein